MTAKRDPICGDPAALAGYLYEECDAEERAAMSAHLAVCERCTAELAGLRSTRDTLAAWMPPETVLDIQITAEAVPAVVPIRSRWGWATTPAWTQAAAAVLLFALGATVAALLNVEVRYDVAGLTVRTGWGERPTAAPVAAAVDPAALDERIRTVVRQTQDSTTASAVVPVAASNSAAGSGASPEELLRRVEQMLAASENRQQRELALRVSQVLHDVDSQHRADIARIERTVSPVAGLTAAEVQEQGQMLNYLMRVSQTK